jgi:alpha-beta hydrolase superfamily lysophospholipase
MSKEVSLRDREPKPLAEKRSKRPSTKRRVLRWGFVTFAILVIVGVGFTGVMLIFASNQLLSPSFRGVTKNLSVCKAETEKYFGKACGNLRETHQFAFSEVKIPSLNGYELPGWLVKSADNGKAPPRGAIMLVHAGGSDRREDTRYIAFYLRQGLDVLTFDLGCHGEAPCPIYGMSYGARESRDVLGAYRYLTDRYQKVYAMASSVGAASILIALPEMPKLSGAIAENTSFQRLIKEAKESRSMPASLVNLLLKVTMLRGKFDGETSPEHSLQRARNVPVFFIHSKRDTTCAYQQTEDLFNLYKGPKTVWYPDVGEHAAIWDANPAEYEKRVAEFLCMK